MKPSSDNEGTGYLRGSILPLLVWKVDGGRSSKAIHSDCKYANDMLD